MPARPSMRFQTAAIIVVGFLLSHAAGLLFYSLDRRGALEMTEAMDLIERAAGISRLLRELPASWQTSIREFAILLAPSPRYAIFKPSSLPLYSSMVNMSVRT